MLPIAILAGGFGTRLGAITADIPKYLLSIHGKPFADWQLRLLINAGYRDFVFCLSNKASVIQDYLGNGDRYGARFEYSLDGQKQLGTGGAVKGALPYLSKRFAVIYGDSYLPINYQEVEEEFKNIHQPALMTIYKNQNLLDASNIEYKNEKIVNYEKGSKDQKMDFIDYGLTYFEAQAFDVVEHGQASDISSICHELSLKGQLAGFEIKERFYEVGSITGIDEFEDFARKAKS